MYQQSCSQSGCCSHEPCPCSCHSCTCCKKGGQHPCHEDKHGDDSRCKEEAFASHLLEMADHAWMEVLKEKMKEQVEVSCKNLEELAKIVVEANGEKWKHKLAKGKRCEEYRKKIAEFFKGSCSENCL